MVLSPQCVAREFSKLREWAGQPPLSREFLTEIYDSLVTKGVTDVELVAAAKAWRFKSRFFPAPQELLDLLKVDSKNKALLEWSAITQNTGNSPTTGLSDVGRRALKAIGGRWAVNNEPAGVVRKRFLETYEAFAKAETSNQIKADAESLAIEAGGYGQNVIDIASIGRKL